MVKIRQKLMRKYNKEYARTLYQKYETRKETKCWIERYSWIERLTIIKMSDLPKVICTFSALMKFISWINNLVDSKNKIHHVIYVNNIIFKLTRITNKMLKKNTFGRCMLLCLKTYKATVIREYCSSSTPCYENVDTENRPNSIIA